jgi:flagellar hook assembly protein FlgD
MRLARIVFALVLLATFIALGVTQWLKHAPTAVQQLEISPATLTPGAAGEAGTEHIEFHIQHSDHIDVGVIDSRGRTVHTLASGRWLRGYKRLTLSWNGTQGDGRHAPAGSYRLRIYLEQRKREVISPVSFEVLRAWNPA